MNDKHKTTIMMVRVRLTATDGTKMADIVAPGRPLDTIKRILDNVGPTFIHDAMTNLGGITVSATIEG